jgi:hypothetical protein
MMTGNFHKLVRGITAAILSIAVAANAEILLNDNFETVSGATSIPVSGGIAFYPDTNLWTLTNAISPNMAVCTQASGIPIHQGSRVLRLSSTGQVNPTLSANFTNTSSVVELSMWLYVPGNCVGQRVFDMTMNDPTNGNIGPYVSINSRNGTWAIGVFTNGQSTATFTALTSPVMDKWTRLVMRVDTAAKKFSIMYNGVTYLNGSTGYDWFTPGWVNNLGKVSICGPSSADSVAVYVDDIVVTDGAPTEMVGDCNGDGKVDVGDLSILAGNYGIRGTASWSKGDYDGDGNVNVVDLSILAGNYGFQGLTEQMLFTFDSVSANSRIMCSDATIAKVESENGPALRITTGHNFTWPGIQIQPASGSWDLSQWSYVAVDVRNVGTNEVEVSLRVDDPNADGENHCANGGITLMPGESGILRTNYKRSGYASSDITLFGMRANPDGFEGQDAIDAENVVRLLVIVSEPTEGHVFEISNIRAQGVYVPLSDALKSAATFFPFIDEFGQYIHKDWPGKVHSQSEMAANIAKEEQDLQAYTGPANWDRYGGWADGPTLTATGFFRVEKYNGKWWFVDPVGKLFFSSGIDCIHPVNTTNATGITDRDTWFSYLPPNVPGLFGKCYDRYWYPSYGYYVGKSPIVYDFFQSNLIHKYGSDFINIYANKSHQRLRSWGVNTIGNWSSPRVTLLRQTPYVYQIYPQAKALAGSASYAVEFWDVFDSGLPGAIQAGLNAEIGKSVNDPWCIGYFSANELKWGDETHLARATLASPADQAAKVVFVQDLKTKYTTIAGLNAVWGTSYASWDDFLQSRTVPDANGGARADLLTFNQKTVEQYFKVCRDNIKAVAPHNLYLGCRFSNVNLMADTAASKYCDVVSYNRYHYSVGTFKTPSNADVPLLIGEFHFGAFDRGMFFRGLRATASQSERARAYMRYVQGALRHPRFVGCHWFQFNDQHTTGRVFDEENAQVGFTDICDTPYPEMVNAARSIGYNMYSYRSNSNNTDLACDFNCDGVVNADDFEMPVADTGLAVNVAADFNADYAKIFGTTAATDPADDAVDEDDVDSSACGGLGLPLIAGLVLMGLMLAKLDDQAGYME